jgi:hypothetical protein
MNDYLTVSCPECLSLIGEKCASRAGMTQFYLDTVHPGRIEAWSMAQELKPGDAPSVDEFNSEVAKELFG